MSSAALEMLTSRGHGSAGKAAAGVAAGALAACAATWVETAKNVASATLDATMTRRIFMVRPDCKVTAGCAGRSIAMRRYLPAERRTHCRSAHDQLLYRFTIVAMLLMMRRLLREHQLHLRPNLPIRPEIGLDHIVVGRYLRVHRQLAEMKNLADATTDRHRPLLTAFSFPV